MNQIINHLWQSTAFTAVVALAALALRRNSPRLRYWLWLAASVKFLIPFSLIVSTGARIQFSAQTLAPHAAAIGQMSTYFEPLSESVNSVRTASSTSLPNVMFAAIWLAGVCFLLYRWFLRWRTLRRAVRLAIPLPSRCPIPVVSSAAMLEPGVFGIFRPILLLPDGLADRLTPKQFEAIIVHELRHVHCSDNLTAAIHMAVESLFWFHPFVWWIGAQLMDERERDCDAAALRQGCQAGDYARGIVHVCETYVRTQLPCAPGISGTDLKKRIRQIMTWQGSLPMTLPGKVLLVSAALAAVSVPFTVGVMRAQNATAPGLAFEVASVRINKSGDQRYGLRFLPGGRVSAQNAPIRYLVLTAYGVSFHQIAPAPDVLQAFELRYDIEATAEPGVIPTDASPKELNVKLRSMLQTLLVERFKLTVHRELKEHLLYALVIAKGGPKLQKAERREQDCTVEPTAPTASSCHWIRGGLGQGLHAAAVDMSDLVSALSNFSDRPVVDKTGLSDLYSIDTPGWVDIRNLPRRPAETDAQRAEEAALADPSRPTLFAVLDALGLKLEARTAPIETFVIDHIEPPSEN